MKRLRLYSFLSATFVILLGFIIQANLQCKTYKTTVNNSYIRSIDELSENISNIENNLTKSMYANTLPEQLQIFIKLSKESIIAKECISSLPLSNIELSKLNLFVAQLGDYTSYLTEKISKGNSISEKDNESLNSILSYSKELNEKLEYIRVLFEDENIDFCTSESEYSEISNNSENIQLTSVTNGFSIIEENFADFPKLIYDGPFSDNVMNKTSVFLQDKQEVSIDEAQQKAASYLAVKKDKLNYIGENSGNLASYSFEYGNKNINITKSGAYIESIMEAYTCSNVNLSCEEAADSASHFMKNMGIDNMVQTYYSSENGICTVNFAYCENDVIYYSDLIKISVEQENGNMISFCATAYLMNHHEREKNANKIDLNLAKSAVSPKLNINTSQLAFIPNSAGKDIECYEFKCTAENGQDVIVYINAETGIEEDILVILEHDGGTLVM